MTVIFNTVYPYIKSSEDNNMSIKKITLFY